MAACKISEVKGSGPVKTKSIISCGLVLAVFAVIGQSLDRSSAQHQSRIVVAMQAGSGGRQHGQMDESRTFEARFWSWLQRVHYTNWAPAPGQDGGFYPGESPHGAFLKMYLNRAAAARPHELPHGSVIVKENYGEDGQTLMAVTVMYRAKGYDAKNKDWYWVKYNPDGSVAMKDDMRLAGQVKGCIECHSGADGNDFAFFNDGK